MNLVSRGFCLACLSSLLACSQTPPASAPSPEWPLPERWSESGSALNHQPVAPNWWAAFGSAELNQLIQQGQQQNLDLKIAAERVYQAKSQVKLAGSSLFPSISANAATSARHNNDNQGGNNTNNSTNLGVAVNYEWDLWGRLAATKTAAEAAFAASQFAQSAARLSLSAAISQAYFQQQALFYRLSLAENNLQIAQRVMAIVQARYQNGTATALDVSRQQTNVLSQRAALLPLQLQIRQNRAAIALLLGQAPESLPALTEQFDQLRPQAIAAALPADLLTRRPDLAQAEAQLRAANANINAARAALLPNVSLSGSAGLSSNSLLSLANPNNALALVANVAHSLFDGGRNQANLDLSQSRQRELVQNYHQAILTALNEVENALKQLASNQQQQQLQQQVANEAQHSLELAELRYQSGADELLSVLDAQRTLFQAKDQQAQLRLSQLLSQVDLYKALGGGWQQRERAQ